jgi:hypothetical protein
MLKYRDFVPQQVSPPGFLRPGEYETFDDALRAANEWLQSHQIKLLGIETVVLPNIWSRYEQGTADASLGISGEDPSHWHQFIRCWYQE